MLTNMHCCPAEDDLCDRHKNVLKPVTVQHCVMWSMWANLISWQHCISRRTYKCTNKIQFFHLLDILIPLTSSDCELSYIRFRLAFVRGLVQEGARVPEPWTVPQVRSFQADLICDTANIGCWKEKEFGVSYVP
jgi:hypothetical protein